MVILKIERRPLLYQRNAFQGFWTLFHILNYFSRHGRPPSAEGERRPKEIKAAAAFDVTLTTFLLHFRLYIFGIKADAIASCAKGIWIFSFVRLRWLFDWKIACFCANKKNLTKFVLGFCLLDKVGIRINCNLEHLFHVLIYALVAYLSWRHVLFQTAKIPTQFFRPTLFQTTL